jgi:hypothetical protein
MPALRATTGEIASARISVRWATRCLAPQRHPVLLRFLVRLPSVTATGRWRERGRMGEPDPLIVELCTAVAADAPARHRRGVFSAGLGCATARRPCGIQVLLIRIGPRPLSSFEPAVHQLRCELASLATVGPCKLRESAYTPTTQLNTTASTQSGRRLPALVVMRGGGRSCQRRTPASIVGRSQMTRSELLLCVSPVRPHPERGAADIARTQGVDRKTAHPPRTRATMTR